MNIPSAIIQPSQHPYTHIAQILRLIKNAAPASYDANAANDSVVGKLFIFSAT
jgi:hypothetical protein